MNHKHFRPFALILCLSTVAFAEATMSGEVKVVEETADEVVEAVEETTDTSDEVVE